MNLMSRKNIETIININYWQMFYRAITMDYQSSQWYMLTFLCIDSHSKLRDS